jgi:hypothetical protein
LVAEYTTQSAPSSNGFCQMGLANGFPGDLRHGRDVDHLERRIGRAFQEEHLGFRPHGGAPRAEVGAVDEGRGNAEARQQLGDHIAARPEQRPRRDDVVAGAQLPHERRRHRRHAGRRGARRLGAFKRRHAPLEHGHGRI